MATLTEAHGILYSPFVPASERGAFETAASQWRNVDDLGAREQLAQLTPEQRSALEVRISWVSSAPPWQPIEPCHANCDLAH